MENQIKLRELGRSGLKISPIGLGCWQFSKAGNFAGKFWPNLDDELIHQIVKVSLQGGINWFDTAELYGNGQSETMLSRSLRAEGKKPGEVVVATKWWPMFRTAANISKTIGDRVRFLEPYPIDLYMVHQPFGFSSETAEMKAMAKLVKAGKIRNVGVSNFSAKKMRNAWKTLQDHGLSLQVNQVRYSLLDRKIEANGILDTAKELGITLIAYSPLAQGLLTGKFHDAPELIKGTGYRRYMPAFQTGALKKSRPVIDALKDLSVKYKVTPSQIALNWLIHHHGETVVAIPGATKLSHAEDNIGAMQFALSKEDMVMLDGVSKGFK
jgi:aryl-alcohol dehydrogenase-like predicted oxidoreductase